MRKEQKTATREKVVIHKACIPIETGVDGYGKDSFFVWKTLCGEWVKVRGMKRVWRGVNCKTCRQVHKEIKLLEVTQ